MMPSTLPVSGGSLPEGAGIVTGVLSQLGSLLESALSLGILALFLLFFVVGLFLIYSGYGTFRQSLRIRGTPTETVDALAQGRTDLEGTVVAGQESIDQPFRDGECVFLIWQVFEETDDGMELLASAGASTRFLLDDGTGTVVVEDPMVARQQLQRSTTGTAAGGTESTTGTATGDTASTTETVTDDTGSPAEAAMDDVELSGATMMNARAETAVSPDVVELSDGSTFQTTVAPNADPPGAIARWCREQGLSPRSEARRRYRQHVIPVGATVYVMGATKREPGVDTDDAIDDRIIGVDDASAHFLVAEGTEAELIDRWQQRATRSIFSGLVFAALGLGLTLSQLL